MRADETCSSGHHDPRHWQNDPPNGVRRENDVPVPTQDMEVHDGVASGPLRGVRRPEDPAGAGHRGVTAPAQDAHRAGRQRDRPPEADGDAARPGPEGGREGGGLGPPSPGDGRPGPEVRTGRRVHQVHAGGRGLRQPAHRHRGRSGDAQADAPSGHRGGQRRQARRPTELSRPSAEAHREGAAALPARPGQDAEAHEHGHAVAQRDYR